MTLVAMLAVRSLWPFMTCWLRRYSEQPSSSRKEHSRRGGDGGEPREGAEGRGAEAEAGEGEGEGTDALSQLSRLLQAGIADDLFPGLTEALEASMQVRHAACRVCGQRGIKRDHGRTRVSFQSRSSQQRRWSIPKCLNTLRALCVAHRMNHKAHFCAKSYDTWYFFRLPMCDVPDVVSAHTPVC